MPTRRRPPSIPKPYRPIWRVCWGKLMTEQGRHDRDPGHRLPAYPQQLGHPRAGPHLHPTTDELALARRTTCGMVSCICFLVLLKSFQRLGYFITLTDVPPPIVQHIADTVGGTVSRDDLVRYAAAGTRGRHWLRSVPICTSSPTVPRRGMSWCGRWPTLPRPKMRWPTSSTSPSKNWSGSGSSCQGFPRWHALPVACAPSIIRPGRRWMRP